jgi:hypothetical protein
MVQGIGGSPIKKTFGILILLLLLETYGNPFAEKSNGGRKNIRAMGILALSFQTLGLISNYGYDLRNNEFTFVIVQMLKYNDRKLLHRLAGVE